MELKLLNVARASLEELLLDYEDYLRHHRHTQWLLDDPEALAVRGVPRAFKQRKQNQSDMTDLSDQERWELYARWLESPDAAVRANATICLIHQANYLLDQQIAALEKAFIEDGGYQEQLASARLAERQRRKQGSGSESSPERIPHCPKCGRLTVLRTAKNGPNAGQPFWGCSNYPECTGLLSL